MHIIVHNCDHVKRSVSIWLVIVNKLLEIISHLQWRAALRFPVHVTWLVWGWGFISISTDLGQWGRRSWGRYSCYTLLVVVVWMDVDMVHSTSGSSVFLWVSATLRLLLIWSLSSSAAARRLCAPDCFTPFTFL